VATSVSGLEAGFLALPSRSWCISVPEQSSLNAFACALIDITVLEQMAVAIERHLNGRVPHQLL
jgi:hypothetical protein